MGLSGFLGNMNLIFDFIMSLLQRVMGLVSSHYILLLPIAIWVVYRVCKLFHLL